MVEAYLGIQTSADLFQTVQANYEQATAERDSGRQEGLFERERERRRSVQRSSGACLRNISRVWGEEKIQHYQWASAGEKYCSVLNTASSQVPNWVEASTKLNQLILRRIQMRGRQLLNFSINPINLIDLENLKRWRDQNAYVKMNDPERVSLHYRQLTLNDIPDTYGFDKYGLIVQGEFVSMSTDEGSRQCPTPKPRSSLSRKAPVAGQSNRETRGRLKRPNNFASLKAVGRIWGGDKVQYYQWADRGEKFRNKLCTAAREVSDWDEAVVKLNRLIHRRTQQLGRREVKESANPIEQDDLTNLKAWTDKDLYVKRNDHEGIALPFRKLAVVDLPAGFGFDKFGLLVRKEQQQSGSVLDSGVAAVFDVTGSRQQPQGLRKRRRYPLNNNQPRPKRARTTVYRERSDEEHMEDLASVLRSLDFDFAEKERLSQDQEWCEPVPHARKVSTVQEFYKAFHDTRTLPIHTCIICYRKCAKAELEEIDWDRWARFPVEKRHDSPFACRRCFPRGEKIPGCPECVRYLGRGALCPAAQLHVRLGCEHMFPDELKSLTPVEEKLIALNSCYGFITRYSLPDGQRQSVRYPKHIKGHITVFPNNVQELVTNVLPHPLLKVMDEIHVSWHGAEKPAPSDLSALLSVRRRVVERALVWLKKHNPLYSKIHIDRAEMDSWDASPHGVPSQVYDRLERNEPSAWERARTGQVVPPMERGLDDEAPVDIKDVLATLSQGHNIAGDGGEADAPDHLAGENEGEEADVDSAARPIHEISSSGMFALDTGPDVPEVEKLRSVCNALGQPALPDPMQGIASAGWAEIRRGNMSEPYILVSRGDDFADSFDTRFFAKTFPTLFPLGNGGPRLAEENITDVAGDLDGSVNAEATAQNLVSSRNMSLETWARLALQRHGGRFGKHHIFAFLVFNMGVRSRNRRVSMLSVTRKNFPRVERIVRSLSPEMLEAAKVELEASGKTADEGVNELLRSLSLYGFRQPMSRESRLSMRRKIKSLIIRYGIPAIWFTLNPNDITNPVKLRLAAYRGHEPGEAEAFLTNLDLAYKRTRLAISDPVSSAIFFHREISMFFKYYVKTGEESVFGRINQYFGAVETNERGALHLHGLLWLQGNMQLSSVLRDVEGEDQTEYRERVIRYVDSVFTEDLDQEASSVVQSERSVTSDISSLLQDSRQFATSFEEEANFCAGATQIHTHSPTCVKYAIQGGRGQKGNLCRFKAPWRLVERTAFTEDGVLQIRRGHNMVNRWNKAIAVGLRHNHDISFIATQCKTMAIVFYVTNYATKVEDPVWKRVAAAAEIFDVFNEAIAEEQVNATNAAHGVSDDDCSRRNKTRQFLMRVANRIFTERPLSQVEVVAHLLGYPTEFANNDGWTFLKASMLYWHIFRRWSHLRRASGMENVDEPVDDTVLLEEAGQRISFVQAYPHRGRVLQGLSLYDYMCIVKLKRKRNGAADAWDEVQFDSGWPLSRMWVQALRKPGKLAVVCLDGYLSMDFNEEEEQYHRRAAVQHLALFVPWELFLCETSGDINAIWERQKQALPRRVSFLADNIQLLRRSAEDVKRDARQWAALSGEGDPAADATESGVADGDDEQGTVYRSDNIGSAIRLIDVLRNTLGNNQITAGSKEISTMVQELCRFQLAALSSKHELCATIIPEQGPRIVRLPGEPSRMAEIPRQEQVRSIKSQQTSVSREREKMIQGIQSHPKSYTTGHSEAMQSVLNGFGEDDIDITPTDSETLTRGFGPSTSIRFGPATSFVEAGRQLAESFTLNRRQSVAFRIICRQLDRAHCNERGTPQLCQFIGGEGGTGKTRIIEAVGELFASKGISHRLLVTATSGTAAARINGITIHSACGFSKDASQMGINKGFEGVGASNTANLYVDGQARMDWQEKWLLIIDEVSMLGARTLYAVNQQLCKLRGCAQDFGGIPIVLFSGDFHQFRPIQERSIVLASSAIPWDEEKSFRVEQRYQHDKAHGLWKKFTTVVMLKEQVRAAGDPRLRRLLTRIRLGMQDQTDVDLLNSTCYQEGKRIPWERGITVVTPLNRNRWNLNVEATLSFQRQWQAPLRIFISEHKWKDGQPTEEEAIMILNQGDDSSIPVPAVFMFVPGMSVVVNRNTYQGLKMTNGAGYEALDVILDKAYPGHRINTDTILHFGPPAGILLAADSTRDFHFVGMPPGAILLTPVSTRIECQRKRPWQQTDVTRRGLPCVAAFACTDYKVQGRTLDRVALELRGTRTTNIDGQAVPTQCDPYSLYVQLSRCRSLDGIILMSKARERDFVGNKVPENMVAAEERLELLSEATIRETESRGWTEK